MTPDVAASASPPSLAERLLSRDPRAVARAITLVESESPAGATLIGQIYARTGRAYLVGVTGAPGAGKSTLVDRLIAEFRREGSTVGVVAVDPTSPFTGGAILGDRVRMHGHFEDDGVFIRSMATRGHLGGLARTTAEVATILDAAGYDIVIIETVGVGQDEVDVVRTADVSIVVVVPGTGDEVQALKAGIMEIADIFVVNKADRDGADRTAASIETTLALEDWAAGEWRPPVVRTEATTGRGLSDLMEAIARFRTASAAESGARRRERAEWRLREILGRRFMDHVEHTVLAPGEFEALLERVASRGIDPYSAAESVLSRAMPGGAVGALDHVGVATRDASALVAMFRDLFGLETDEPELVGPHRLRFVQSGATTIELVEPVSADSPVAAFLDTRGTALHHLCLRVANVDAAIEQLERRGVRLIDQRGRAGAHGSRIAFLHPSSTNGLLIELKEPRHD